MNKLVKHIVSLIFMQLMPLLIHISILKIRPKSRRDRNPWSWRKNMTATWSHHKKQRSLVRFINILWYQIFSYVLSVGLSLFI